MLGAIIAVVVIIVIIVVAASSASNNSSKLGSGTKAHPAAKDVSVSGCRVDSLGLPTGKAKIVNHSSGESDYTFTVDFLNSAGTVVAQGAGLENNIAPGQTATATVTGDQQISGSVTCKVVDVTRLASS